MPLEIQDSVLRQRSEEQNPSDFLRTTITLSKDVYNIYRILESSAIRPSTETTYSLSQIQNSLTKALGGEVSKIIINCQQDEKGNSLLSDISICLDKNYRPIDCQIWKPSRCDPDRIHYPINSRKARVSLY